MTVTQFIKFSLNITVTQFIKFSLNITVTQTVYEDFINITVTQFIMFSLISYLVSYSMCVVPTSQLLGVATQLGCVVPTSQVSYSVVCSVHQSSELLGGVV